MYVHVCLRTCIQLELEYIRSMVNRLIETDDVVFRQIICAFFCPVPTPILRSNGPGSQCKPTDFGSVKVCRVPV